MEDNKPWINFDEWQSNIKIKEMIINGVDNKYYTPSIEEFRVGFEYEVYDTIDGKSGEPKWIGQTITRYTELDDLADSLEEGFIRVKYLDREDIESFLFILTKDYSDQFVFQKTDRCIDDLEIWFEVTLDKIESRLGIERYETVNCRSNSKVLFEGSIKNKSELQVLLKQLRIV